MVKMLLNHGARADSALTSNGSSPLHAAAKRGYHNVVARLLKATEANINLRRTTDGATALFVAAEKGFGDVVKVLIQHGADVNQRANTGATPLLVAVYHSYEDVVRQLIQAGCRVNSNSAGTDVGQDTQDASPLMMAAHRCHLRNSRAIVEMLLKAGADRTLKSQMNGLTARGLAERKGCRWGDAFWWQH